MSSAENALAILSLLTPEQPVLRVGEVCRELGLPKSSVSRLLKTMAESGLLERERDDLGYVVGRRALELADIYLSRHTLLDLVDLALDRLVHEFGFVGYATVLSGSDAVIIRLKYGSYPLRLVQPVGYRIPAFDTATGRALLSRLKLTPALAASVSGRRIATGRISDELDRVHRQGVSATLSTTIPGIGAIGAAVRGPDGHDAIGFAVSFPLSATDRALRSSIGHRVRTEATSIAYRIRDPYWAAIPALPLELTELDGAVDPPTPRASSKTGQRKTKSGRAVG